MTEAAARPESAGLRNALVIATVIAVLMLMISLPMLAMSPMIFDSGESPTAWGVFIALWSAPVVLAAGIAIGWVGFARDSRNVAITGLTIAALPILAGAGVLLMAGF